MFAFKPMFWAYRQCKTERFVWILVFPQPSLTPIFFQPLFIRMAPARHCDIQLKGQVTLVKFVFVLDKKSVIMSCFLMQPAFRQFRKNWKNRLSFKDAIVQGWGRLILKKLRKTKEAASGAAIANQFDPLQQLKENSKEYKICKFSKNSYLEIKKSSFWPQKLGVD